MAQQGGKDGQPLTAHDLGIGGDFPTGDGPKGKINKITFPITPDRRNEIIIKQPPYANEEPQTGRGGVLFAAEPGHISGPLAAATFPDVEKVGLGDLVLEDNVKPGGRRIGDPLPGAATVQSRMVIPPVGGADTVHLPDVAPGSRRRTEKPLFDEPLTVTVGGVTFTVGGDQQRILPRRPVKTPLSEKILPGDKIIPLIENRTNIIKSTGSGASQDLGLRRRPPGGAA